MSNRQALVTEACRQSFYPFVQMTFQILNASQPFYSNWHMKAIAHHLEQVECGNIKRLIIETGPRHAKSLISNVSFSGWVLGRQPSRRIVSASYSNNLSAKHARDFRRLTMHERYRRVFPQMQISGGRNTELEQETSQQGFRFATSVTGTLTGRGGDITIIDDPIKPGEVMSDVERGAVNDWYDGTVLTRHDNPNEGAVIVVMQRLHEDDLVGHLTREPDHGWTILSIPAIATEDATYRIGNRDNDVHFRQEGEVIDARRLDREKLDEIRRSMGSLLFSAQYQQQPLPYEGNLIKRHWLKRYGKAPSRDQFDAIVQSWDTASEIGEYNDFSVCTTWGTSGEQVYLLHTLRRRVETPDLHMLAEEHAIRMGANIVLVEKAGSGIGLAQQLRRKLNASVLPRNPRGDKASRLLAVQHMFENGSVLLPEDAAWLDILLKELLGFPSDRHDDQVDSVTLFLKYFAGRKLPQFTPDGKKQRRRLKRRSSGRERSFVGRKNELIKIF